MSGMKRARFSGSVKDAVYSVKRLMGKGMGDLEDDMKKIRLCWTRI